MRSTYLTAVSTTVKVTITSFWVIHPEEAELLEKAREVRRNAYAPYSHYWVGAAIRSARTGRIYVGCNVECVTWTQTTHAEQAAIAAMIAAEGPNAKIGTLAVVGGPEGKEIVYAAEIAKGEHRFADLPAPCGHCLQIIWEFCHNDPNIPILSVTAAGEICRMRIADVFPVRFGPQWFEIERKAA